MAEMKRKAYAEWKGGLKEGAGAASGESEAFQDVSMTFPSRFQEAAGSNPEELIAAAHATCYSMALANQLEQAGATPKHIATNVTVTLRQDGGDISIPAAHIVTSCQVDGISEDEFQKVADTVKQACPVSKLLAPGLESMTLEATLAS